MKKANQKKVVFSIRILPELKPILKKSKIKASEILENYFKKELSNVRR